MTHAPEPWAEDGLSRHCGQDLTASLPAKVSQHENPTSPNPTFVADVRGDSTVRLVVTDEFGASSGPDTVLVTFNNVPPVADAGDTQTVLVGATVVPDGSGSFDANGDPLTFRWSLVDNPPPASPSWTTPLPKA